MTDERCHERESGFVQFATPTGMTPWMDPNAIFRIDESECPVFGDDGTVTYEPGMVVHVPWEQYRVYGPREFVFAVIALARHDRKL